MEDNFQDFRQTIKVFEKEYNAASRKNFLATEVRSLKVSQLLMPDCTASDAIERVHEEILKFSNQAPQHARSESYKLEYLQSAVIWYSWAYNAWFSANTGGLSYQAL